jgi:hypothetical protein
MKDVEQGKLHSIGILVLTLAGLNLAEFDANIGTGGGAILGLEFEIFMLTLGGLHAVQRGSWVSTQHLI